MNYVQKGSEMTSLRFRIKSMKGMGLLLMLIWKRCARRPRRSCAKGSLSLWEVKNCNFSSIIRLKLYIGVYIYNV